MVRGDYYDEGLARWDEDGLASDLKLACSLDRERRKAEKAAGKEALSFTSADAAFSAAPPLLSPPPYHEQRKTDGGGADKEAEEAAAEAAAPVFAKAAGC